MVIKTTNHSTITAAFNVKARIEREIEEMLVLAQQENIVQLNQKLTFIYRLTERFREDEKDNLVTNDEIALDFLQGQILEFLKKLAEKNPAKRLDGEHQVWEVKSLQNAVKSALEQPAT